MRTSTLTLFLLAAMSGAAMAADKPAPPLVSVEYVSGHEGAKSMLGDLWLTPEGLTFTHDDYGSAKKRRMVFAVPFSAIVSVEDSIERENYFGVFSSNAVRNQGYVRITTETQTAAEVLVFKVDKDRAKDVAVKIRFAAKKAKGEPPADTATP